MYMNLGVDYNYFLITWRSLWYYCATFTHLILASSTDKSLSFSLIIFILNMSKAHINKTARIYAYMTLIVCAKRTTTLVGCACCV